VTDTATVALLVGATFMAAGFVKGVAGLGLPTVAMGLLSLVMAPAAAATLLVVPSLLTNFWQLLSGPKLAALLRRLATMMLAVLAGTALGINVLTGSSAGLAQAALGAILALYGVFGLTVRGFSVPPRAERWLSPIVGLVTGVITGATGIFAIPAVPYLHSLDLPKDELIQALGLSFTVSTIGLAAALIAVGKYELVAAGNSLLAVVPALLGMHLGRLVRDKLSPERFRRWFFIGLVALGLYMLLRA
jgi:uncharacterized membrane protein YfcA